MNALAPDAAAIAIGPADKPELVDRVTRSTAGGLREVELHIGDMRCTSCAERIRSALGAVGGVHDVNLNPARRVASITYDPRRAALSAVVLAVERAGYTPAFAGVEADDPAARSARRRALKRLGVAGLAMMQTMMFAAGSYAGAFDGISPFYESLMRWSGLIFALPVVLYSASSCSLRATSSRRRCTARRDSTTGCR
jgi:Cu2+-exporting ATPase